MTTAALMALFSIDCRNSSHIPAAFNFDIGPVLRTRLLEKASDFARLSHNLSELVILNFAKALQGFFKLSGHLYGMPEIGAHGSSLRGTPEPTGGTFLGAPLSPSL
jgi:hypothetical protein